MTEYTVGFISIVHQVIVFYNLPDMGFGYIVGHKYNNCSPRRCTVWVEIHLSGEYRANYLDSLGETSQKETLDNLLSCLFWHCMNV